MGVLNYSSSFLNHFKFNVLLVVVLPSLKLKVPTSASLNIEAYFSNVRPTQLHIPGCDKENNNAHSLQCDIFINELDVVLGEKTKNTEDRALV